MLTIKLRTEASLLSPLRTCLELTGAISIGRAGCARRYFVNENTGMAGVIPAWKIAEVLNCEKLVNSRLAGSERLLKQLVKTSSDRQDTDAANTN